MKRFLYKEGITVSSPRESFREAGSNGIIEDVGLWLDFIIVRNKTVHTYNELVLKEIIDVAPIFEKELKKLITALENKVGNGREDSYRRKR